MVLQAAAASVCASCAAGRGADATVVDLGRPAAPGVHAASPAARRGAPRSKGIDWLTDEVAARAKAKRDDLALFVFVSAEWDVASKEMRDGPLADPRVVAAAGQVVPLHLDLTDLEGPNRAAVSRLGIAAIPALLVIAPSGREIYRRESASVDREALLEALEAP